MDIKRIADSVRAQRGLRYLFVSTGPGYVPRSQARGLRRVDEMKGQTFNAGRNEAKRQRRAKLKLLQRFRLPASLLARIN